VIGGDLPESEASGTENGGEGLDRSKRACFTEEELLMADAEEVLLMEEVVRLDGVVEEEEEGSGFESELQVAEAAETRSEDVPML